MRKYRYCIAIAMVGSILSIGLPLTASNKAYPDLPHLESDIEFCKVDNEIIRENVDRYLEGKSDGKDRAARFYGQFAPSEADRAQRTCLAYNLGMEAIRNQYHDKMVFVLCEKGTVHCTEMQKGIWLRSLSHEDRP